MQKQRVPIHCRNCGLEIWQKVPADGVEWEHCETGSRQCYDFYGSIVATPEEGEPLKEWEVLNEKVLQ